MASADDVRPSPAPHTRPLPTIGKALPWREFEALLDAVDPQQPPTHGASPSHTSEPDAATVARLSLMAAAAGRSRLKHGEALQRLAGAVPVFVASGMPREAQAARCEAAGHLIELGCAHEARELLQAQRDDDPARRSGLTLAEQAKLATALLDQRLGLDALRIATALVPAVLEADAPLQSRLLSRTLALCTDVLLASELGASRRIDTALADGMPPAAGQDTATPTAEARRRLLVNAVQALEASLPRDPDLATLTLLHACLTGHEGVHDRLQALTQQLSGHEARLPSAWLRLCVAYRLSGRVVLAAHCASEAIGAAQATGSLRLQQKALKESALIQMETGQSGALADTWRALRQLDAAIWGARGEFNRLRPQFQAQGSPAPEGVPEASLGSTRALHVEAAIARLKADPSRRWKVDALAEATGVSRRTLEQAFRLHSGLSVSDVIREHRIQRALQLLRSSDAAIKRVAVESGYSSASTLCRELREHTGLSPRQIRMQHRRQA